MDIVFDSEDRVFPLEMVLFMRGASLNEQENVTKGVHQVYGLEDLLIHLFFEHFLNEIGDCEWNVKLKKVIHDIIEVSIGVFLEIENNHNECHVCGRINFDLLEAH